MSPYSESERLEWFRWIATIVFALGVALFVRYYFLNVTLVNGISMQPTLYSNDRMLLNKLQYKWAQPRHFDIVIFQLSEEERYVKRVIGVPGDTIRYEADQLFINGVAQEEPYLERYRALLPHYFLQFTPDFTLEQVTGERRVPEGSVFVLGDNRPNSKDSRAFGFVPLETIEGRATFILLPTERFQPLKRLPLKKDK